jgi:hypothetical protein
MVSFSDFRFSFPYPGHSARGSPNPSLVIGFVRDMPSDQHDFKRPCSSAIKEISAGTRVVVLSPE